MFERWRHNWCVRVNKYVFCSLRFWDFSFFTRWWLTNDTKISKSNRINCLFHTLLSVLKWAQRLICCRLQQTLPVTFSAQSKNDVMINKLSGRFSVLCAASLVLQVHGEAVLFFFQGSWSSDGFSCQVFAVNPLFLQPVWRSCSTAAFLQTQLNPSCELLHPLKKRLI